MLQDKIKILFKRRRDNKIRYSGNKIYASRVELKHTNTKLFITLHIYNNPLNKLYVSIRCTNGDHHTSIDCSPQHSVRQVPTLCGPMQGH